MTKRIEVAKAPAPLEEYIKHFDPLFGKSNQREGFMLLLFSKITFHCLIHVFCEGTSNQY